VIYNANWWRNAQAFFLSPSKTSGGETFGPEGAVEIGVMIGVVDARLGGEEGKLGLTLSSLSSSETLLHAASSSHSFSNLSNIRNTIDDALSSRVVSRASFYCQGDVETRLLAFSVLFRGGKLV
jgi:hypothetical protein